MEQHRLPAMADQNTFLTKKPTDGIVTSSWLKMLWLTRVQGYKITNVRHVPKKGAFGQVKYDSMWFLDVSRNGRNKG